MSQISHKATVTKVNKESITARFERRSACAGCERKSSCSLAENQTKIITVPTQGDKEYKIGQTVDISIAPSAGGYAVFFAYILPLTIVLATLFITHKISQNDEKSAIFSLISLFLYYFLLFFIKKRIKSKIQFRID